MPGNEPVGGGRFVEVNDSGGPRVASEVRTDPLKQAIGACEISDGREVAQAALSRGGERTDRGEEGLLLLGVEDAGDEGEAVAFDLGVHEGQEIVNFGGNANVSPA